MSNKWRWATVVALATMVWLGLGCWPIEPLYLFALLVPLGVAVLLMRLWPSSRRPLAIAATIVAVLAGSLVAFSVTQIDSRCGMPTLMAMYAAMLVLASLVTAITGFAWGAHTSRGRAESP